MANRPHKLNSKTRSVPVICKGNSEETCRSKFRVTSAEVYLIPSRLLRIAPILVTMGLWELSRAFCCPVCGAETDEQSAKMLEKFSHESLSGERPDEDERDRRCERWYKKKYKKKKAII